MNEFTTETFFVLADSTLEKHVQREMVGQFPALENYEYVAWEEEGRGIFEHSAILGTFSPWDIEELKQGKLYTSRVILEWLVANKVLPAGDYLIRC